MRKWLLLLPFVFIIKSATSQQISTFSNYILDPFSLNPALAGLQNCFDMKVGRRVQWTDVYGAPEVNFFSINFMLNRSEKNSFKKQGLGLYFQNQKVGIFNTNYLKLAYAYHLRLWKRYKMSVGLFGGIQQVGLSNASFLNTQDPAYKSDRAYVVPEVSPGIFLYTKKSGLGISLFQAYPKDLGKIGDEARLRQHVFMTFYHKITYGYWNFMPSTLVRLNPYLSPSADINFLADYDNVIAFGVGVRTFRSLQANINIKILDKIRIGYTYEIPFLQNSQQLGPTHEFIVGFGNCFKNGPKPKFICPVFE
jgi:type IX secretion system PorP/SprF family membrane protein